MAASPSDSLPTRTPAARNSWLFATPKPGTRSRLSARSCAPACPSSTRSRWKKWPRRGNYSLSVGTQQRGAKHMAQNLDQTMALLERTPAVLNALLRGLPDTWTRGNEGDGTWTPGDVVAHLIHAEREDWIPRARTILDHGETQPFAPFDREGNFQQSRRRTLEQLLDEFAQARAESLQQLDSMNLLPRDLEKKGKHPALGAVTLSELLATWAAHDLTHLHQISRVLAVQYREAVGPLSRFLGVMHCAGHSG